MDELTLRYPQISLLTGIKRHTLNARAKAIFEPKDFARSQGNQVLLNPSQVKKLIEDKLVGDKGKIIYLGNLKGGVGKTSLSYLLINTLAALGLKVCAIDLDVQSNLTAQYLNINSKQPVFFDVIDGKIEIQDVIVPVSANLDFIPSSLKNSLIQKALSMQAPKHHLDWFNSLCVDYLRSHYDVIVVDTPPHLTTLNSVFCLCLEDNDNIVIPANADEFSLMGLQMFLEDILSIRNSYKIQSSPKISIIMNRFLQQQKTNLEMLVKIGGAYGEMLSEIIIKDSAKIREVVTNKTPIGKIKHGKEVYETIAGLLRELNILKGEG